MILRVLKSNQPVNYLLFPFIALLLWLRSFIYPSNYPFFNGEDQGVLYRPFSYLFENTPFLGTLVSLILVVFLAFVIQQISDSNSFIRIRTKFPAALFIIIVGGLTHLHTLHPVYPAAIFLLFAINSLFGLFDLNKPFSGIFNVGLFLGIAALFYINIIILLPVFLIGIVSLCRDYNWREFVIIIIGVLLPFIFAMGYAFLTDQTIDFLLVLERGLITPNNHFLSNVPLHVFLGLMILIIIAASVKIVQLYDSKKVSVRKYYSLFFLFFISSVLSYVFIPASSQEMLVISAIPATYLVAHLFVNIRNKWIAEWLFLTLVIVVVLLQFNFNFFYG